VLKRGIDKINKEEKGKKEFGWGLGTGEDKKYGKGLKGEQSLSSGYDRRRSGGL